MATYSSTSHYAIGRIERGSGADGGAWPGLCSFAVRMPKRRLIKNNKLFSPLAVAAISLVKV